MPTAIPAPVLGLAALLLLAASAAAQAPAGPAEPEPPAPPALAPPPPVRLPPTAPAAAEGEDPRLSTAPLPGLEFRPGSGWRLRFPNPASPSLPGATTASLGELGRRLAALPTGRVTVIAQASGPANDASVARRLSLERGIAVKAALAAGGLAETRIDIRPAGRTEEATDAADVLPPAPPRPAPR